MDDPIATLRRTREEQELEIYMKYELALRKRYIASSSQEKLYFLNGLEVLITAPVCRLSLKDLNRVFRRRMPRGKKEFDSYLLTLDESRQFKVKHMVEHGLDRTQVQKILTDAREQGTYQGDIAIQVGIPSGSLRASLCTIRRNNNIPKTETNARICSYLLEQGYKIS